MKAIEILKQQYQMIRAARGVLIDFIAQNLPHDLQTPVPAFMDKSLAYLLVHNVNVYRHWLANFAMQLNQPYEEELAFNSIEDIKELYSTVDLLVDGFLNHYLGKFDQTVNGTTASGGKGQCTPLEIFTHVITHEFHHKGQALSMIRLLGPTPPDSDVIRF